MRIVAVLFLAFVLAGIGATSWAGNGKGGGKPGGGGGTPADPAVAYLRGSDLFVADADGSNRSLVHAAPDGVLLGAPRWTPDGRLLFLRHTQGQLDDAGIYVVALDGTGLQEIVALNAPVAHWAEWSPVATPDGSFRIVFSDYPVGESEQDIFVVNSDGSDRVNLTRTSGIYETQPVWSPDGTRLAIWDVTNRDVLVLKLGVADGALAIVEQTNLTAADGSTNRLRASASNPAWAKSSDRLLVSSRFYSPSAGTKSDQDIWLFDLSNTALPVNLTDTPRDVEKWPTWTSGDARIAYADIRDNLYTVATDGSGEPVLIARNVRWAAWRRSAD